MDYADFCDFSMPADSRVQLALPGADVAMKSARWLKVDAP
jgi:hypothetical protein